MENTIIKLEAPMRFKEIDRGTVVFEDCNGKGHTMHYYHCPDCCERNYADWSQMDDLARDYTFRGDLMFEKVNGGFRFGDNELRMFYVPCYSEQNGYYTTRVDIYFDNERVLKTNGARVHRD